MATIFRKTPKGADEIATRANRLAPRLRSALILVDGARDDAQLRKLISQQPDESLNMLAELGFIEVAAFVGPPPKPAKPTPPPPAAEPVAAAVAVVQDFKSFRAEAVRAFSDLVGPQSEALALKMEKTASREQLASLLEVAVLIIENSRNSNAAPGFKAKYLQS